ncbi:MAG: response regulator transcription factor [Schleiferiaceae bacterium]|nr:response regulator transcription factor [Schleiferiaceae bacterium]
MLYILIVEDHPVTAIGSKIMLEETFKDITTYLATNGSEALKEIKKQAMDVVILDIILPDTDTHSLLQEILRLQPKAKVLAFSSCNDEVFAMPYVRMGAAGYISKSAPKTDFILAVQNLIAGKLYLSTELLQTYMEKAGKGKHGATPFEKLSARELELLTHLIKGVRIKEITHIMNIEQSTAATLKNRVMTKLGVDNIIDLVKLANEYNVLGQ